MVLVLVFTNVVIRIVIMVLVMMVIKVMTIKVMVIKAMVLRVLALVEIIKFTVATSIVMPMVIARAMEAFIKIKQPIQLAIIF